jgi:hypothetical protein
MPKRSEQETQADHRVEHDHQHGVHAVTRKLRIVGSRDHHRGDGHDFDADHRQGQDQCSVGFAGTRREPIGVPYDRERRCENQGEQPDKSSAHPQEVGKVIQPGRPTVENNRALSALTSRVASRRTKALNEVRP